MAAKGSVPTFNTLKECLEFLYWLKDDKTGMQSSVANRLKRLLKNRYKGFTQSEIEKALSIFLSGVSKFHTKLCKNARGHYLGNKSPRDVLYALLACIPRLLSAIYFLRYKVDANFKALGGGGWAENQVGLVARSVYYGSQIDKYLIATQTNNYGVIPGGFAPLELNMGHRSGYSPGSKMMPDLIHVSEKHGRGFNVFLDVFVTSVFGKHGADMSNVANALRLVQDFCGIFEKVRDEDDFKNNLQARHHCISWRDLQQHCSKLKKSLEKIFNGNRFSFTGYAREPQYLSTENIAKKMAKWFKTHLADVMEQLKAIQLFDSSKKYPLSGKHIRKGNTLSGGYSEAFTAYFTNNFIRYGFTLYHNNYKVESTPYEDLFDSWNGAILELKKTNDGLDGLVKILNGNECVSKQKDKKSENKARSKPDAEPESDTGPEHKHKPDAETGPEPEPEPELEDDNELEDDLDSEIDSDEELMNQLSDEEDTSNTKSEATKTEAAKPVITKAEAAKPTATKTEATKTEASKSETSAKPPTLKAEGTPDQGKQPEGAQNQGKKAEGAQNQGKKAEGTQDQGKKAEGAQNQGKKAGEDASADTPSSKSTQASSVQSPDPQSSGAPGPGSGQDTGGRAASADSAQQSVQERQPGAGNSSAASSAAGPSQGGGGSGGNGDSGEKGHNPVKRCLEPNIENFWKHREGKTALEFCEIKYKKPSRVPINGQKTPQQLWDDHEKKKEEEERKTQTAYNTYVRQMKQMPNYSSALNGSAVNTPFDGTAISDSSKVSRQQNNAEHIQQAHHSIIYNQQKSDKKMHDMIQKSVQRKKDEDAQWIKNHIYGSHELAVGGIQTTIPNHQPIDSSLFDFEKPIGRDISKFPEFTTNIIDDIKPKVRPTQSTDYATGYATADSRGMPNFTVLKGSFANGIVMGHPIKPPKLPKMSPPVPAVLGLTVDAVPNDKFVRSPPLSGDPVILPSQSAEHHSPVPTQLDSNVAKVYISGTEIPPKPIPMAEIPVDLGSLNPSVLEPNGTSVLAAQHGLGATQPTATVTLDNQIMTKLTGVNSVPIDNKPNQMAYQVPDALNIQMYSTSQPKGAPISNSLQTAKQHSLKVKRANFEFSKYKDVQKRHQEHEDQKIRNEFDIGSKESDQYKKAAEQMKLGDGVEESIINPKLPPAVLPDVLIYSDIKPYIPPPVIDVRSFESTKSNQMYDHEQLPSGISDTKSIPDLQIDVHKRAVQEPSYDVDLDDLYSNADDILKDEYITSDKPYGDDKGFSGVPQSNFNLAFLPGSPGLTDYDDPGMPRDSPRKADERVITPFGTDECLNPWSFDTSTTDIITPPTSPPPATDHLPPPRTVREMLCWLVGLNTQGYIGLISEHVKSILKGYNTDAFEVTGDSDQLTASMVTAKLTETCLYSTTVIFRIRHNNHFEAFSTFDFKSEYSQLHYSPDPACLLCQLLDYVYACHHQLQFLKAQCSRNELHGGWQNCSYGGDAKISSPLQSFLTDGWDSDFETHPFDPGNLCHKSRIRMGFKKVDLPNDSQTGNTLSSILTPSCGASDPLLTLASYLNCLTKSR